MADEDGVTVRRDHAVWREVDGQIIVLDVVSSNYLGVNESGTLLWEAMVGGATRAELVARLGERFSLDPARAADDVDAFLMECRGRGLIE